jgi:hypothetical protein
MQFILMHRQSADEEAGKPVSPELFAGMDKLIQDATTAKAFVQGEGLRSSRFRTRLTFKNGERTIQHGPYEGRNELIAGFGILKTNTREEAIEWAARFADVIGDVEMEVGEICEPWHLGFGPAPSEPHARRYLAMHKATADMEKDVPMSEANQRRMGALMQEAAEAGVLIGGAGLQPSSKAKRVVYEGGKRRSIVDGPFTESKELVAGFSLFELPSMEDALEWTDRFGSLFPRVEVDIRPVHE